jgi:hypothetical membrane protein
MNVSFIAAGGLILLGLYLARSQWPRRRRTAWGIALLAVAGAGKIIVGLVPENTRRSPKSPPAGSMTSASPSA